jgi:hypothetical protein
MLGLLTCAGHLAADEDEAPAKAGGAASTPVLNHEQQQAAGIRVAHPVDAAVPQRIEALGQVLDATALIAEEGELSAAEAAQRASAAEVERLHALYEDGSASLKALQAAQADYMRSNAQQALASSRLALHWGPLAALPPAPRASIIAAAAAGRSLLVRGDLPGRHSLGALPPRALLDVDGVEVAGRVLGVLPQSGEIQSAGVLVEVARAPAGFGPGARVPMVLVSGERKGVVLPRDAVLYDENGAYVYKQLPQNKGEESRRYLPTKVTLLTPSGAGWLVSGVDDDDDIVVQGAGVLWSLQGVGTPAADDDDD